MDRKELEKPFILADIECSRCHSAMGGTLLGKPTDEVIICRSCIKKIEDDRIKQWTDLWFSDPKSWEKIGKTIKTGIKWLSWEQNPKAMVQRGLYHSVERYPEMLPGSLGSPVLGVHFNLFVNEENLCRIYFEVICTQRFTKSITKKLLEIVEATPGVKVVDEDFSENSCQYTIDIAPKVPGKWKYAVIAARNYANGCPKHHTVFCGNGPISIGNNCDWWDKHRKLLREPDGW